MHGIKVRYEYCDHDEAMAAIRAWSKAIPGSDNIPDYPYFEVERVEINPLDPFEMVLWLKLKETRL